MLPKWKLFESNYIKKSLNFRRISLLCKSRVSHSLRCKFRLVRCQRFCVLKASFTSNFKVLKFIVSQILNSGFTKQINVKLILSFITMETDTLKICQLRCNYAMGGVRVLNERFSIFTLLYHYNIFSCKRASGILTDQTRDIEGTVYNLVTN